MMQELYTIMEIAEMPKHIDARRGTTTMGHGRLISWLTKVFLRLFSGGKSFHFFLSNGDGNVILRELSENSLQQ